MNVAASILPLDAFFSIRCMFTPGPVLFQVWKEEHKTIKDSGYVLKDAESFCRSKVKQSVSNLNAHIVSVFSVQEKQVERTNIQNRIKNN